MPIYVNILDSAHYIAGILYASCNANGLISTFAGLALLFCIKLNAAAHRVPRITRFFTYASLRHELFQFEGTHVQLIIPAFFGHKVLMVAPLDDAAVFHDHNHICILYRR